MKLTPIGERVVLKPLKAEEKTKSGIFLPKGAEEKKQGIIESVGELKDNKPIPLNKGDKVIYGGYSSEEIEIDNEKYLIVEFKDIIAKIE
ncbi:MAG: co-chaperone GroES [Nanoarchaeota archaeon]|nr:co-chaperone GroES [Nanoarchaeota archaeon]